MNLKNQDNLKFEDDFKNDDDLKNEDDPKNEDNLKNDNNLTKKDDLNSKKQAGTELGQAQASLSKLESFLIRHLSNTLCRFQFLQYVLRSSSIFLRSSSFLR